MSTSGADAGRSRTTGYDGRDWCRPNTPCMTCRLAQAVLNQKEKR